MYEKYICRREVEDDLLLGRSLRKMIIIIFFRRHQKKTDIFFWTPLFFDTPPFLAEGGVGGGRGGGPPKHPILGPNWQIWTPGSVYWGRFAPYRTFGGGPQGGVFLALFDPPTRGSGGAF